MTVMTEAVSTHHRPARPGRCLLRLVPLVLIGWNAGSITPANAQYYYPSPYEDEEHIAPPFRRGLLPAPAMMRQLRQQGFRPLSAPVLNRDVYVLDAIDPEGASVRVIASAFDGEIVQVFVNRRAPRVVVDPDDDLSPVDRPAEPRRTTPPRPVQPPVARLPEKKVEPRPAPHQNPALTPANPTITKRSPLAIPKDSGPPAPAPQTGSKTTPRVIPLAPEIKAPATTSVPAPEPAPPAASPQAAVPLPVPQAASPPIAVALPPLPPEPQAPDLAAPAATAPSGPPAAILDFRAKDRPKADEPTAATQ